MKYKDKFYGVLSFFTLVIVVFSSTTLAKTTPAGQDQLRIQTGTPQRNGDSLFSYTVEWRVDEGLTYRGTGKLFIHGPDKPNPTSDIQFAKSMASALNEGMEQQYPSWRGVLAEHTQDKPEATLSNKSGFSFTSITFRDYTNQRITYDGLDKNFNSARVNLALDLVLSADVDYIEGFTTYKPTDNHHGSIEISIDGGKPVTIKTDGKTTKQLEQEIANALGPATFSSSALFPNLKDSDTRNNKPFDGSEVQLKNLSAKTITIANTDPSLGILTKFKFTDTNQTEKVFDPVVGILLLGLLAAGYFFYARFQAKKLQNETDQSNS